MRKFARPTKNFENDAKVELKAMENQLNDKITIDNGTMVEAFKYLNYCQLAKKSLISKRFCDLIQSHRRTLALLRVDHISMDCFRPASAVNSYRAVNIFDKELVNYNEWVNRNNYSKQVPMDDQVATAQSTQNPKGYRLSAEAYYKDPNHRERDDGTDVLIAYLEFNDDNWPVFQHFVRFVTDPFIYIDRVRLTYQTDVLDMLSRAINSESRLQCKRLDFFLNGNDQKSLTWTKNHVRCNQFCISDETDPNQDEALLDFFVTEGHCTPSIYVGYRDVNIVASSRDLSEAVFNLVQKFTDLKNSDECQIVEAIEGNFKGEAVEMLKRNYGECFVKEEIGLPWNTHIFEFTNNGIGKKLQLTIKSNVHCMSDFSIKMNKS